MSEDERISAVNSAGYPAPAGITADPVVFAPRGGTLHVLLVPRAMAPHDGRWALPGGFMNPQEEPEETARRKLREKTAVDSLYLEQIATYGSPQRDPRGWIPSVAYLALTPATVLREEETDARWWPVDGLPDLAFDHGRIIRDGIDRLRGKLWYSNIAVALLPERFSLAQARELYEAISGLRYEVSNFRRALEQSELVRPTDHFRQGPAGRPARLYEFVERRPSWSSRRSRIPGVLRH